MFSFLAYVSKNTSKAIPAKLFIIIYPASY